MARQRQLLAIVVTGMVLLSGCTGWGSDGPVDEDDADPAQTDDLEEADDTANESSDSTAETSDDSESNSDDDSERDRDQERSSERESETNTATNTDGESNAVNGDSDAATPSSGDETPTNGGDQDKSTDETSQTRGGDSQSDDSENETDSDELETHELTVTVTDPDGDPVGYAGVSVIDSKSGEYAADGYTDKSGEVTFELVDGSYELHIGDRQIPYVADEVPRLDIDGEDATCTVELQPADDDKSESDTATGVVKVVDQNGEPVANEPVDLLWDDYHEEEYTTDENGEVVLEYETDNALDPVTVYVRDQSESMTIQPDSEAGVQQIEFQVNTEEYDDTATGIVRVVNDDGEPIEGEPVTITPPGSVTESAKYVEHTNEDGEVRIELAAGDPTDVVLYRAEVRDEEKSLAIMSDEHVGVQEVEFNPTDRMYALKAVITVVDEDGDPIEGEPVEARHGLVNDEWEVVGETDENGEIVLVGGSSEPSDVVAQEVRVRDQTITTFLESDRRTEEIVINTTETENETADNESAQNETTAAAT